MNSFDVVVYLALIIAVVTGFKTGLLRSAVTILPIWSRCRSRWG